MTCHEVTHDHDDKMGRMLLCRTDSPHRAYMSNFRGLQCPVFENIIIRFTCKQSAASELAGYPRGSLTEEGCHPDTMSNAH